MDNFCTWIKQVEDRANELCNIFNYKNVSFPWARLYEEKMKAEAAAYQLVNVAFIQANIAEREYIGETPPLFQSKSEIIEETFWEEQKKTFI